MKIVFLDIDGVLNCQSSNSSCCGFLGIDNKKVELLKAIVDGSNAKIVLTSSWRTGWERTAKERQSHMAAYLDRKLRRYRLYIFDKTDDYTDMRGEAVLKWLDGKDVDGYVILDDEVPDYEKCGISDKLVKTEFYDNNGGLNEVGVKEAIGILCQK